MQLQENSFGGWHQAQYALLIGRFLCRLLPPYKKNPDAFLIRNASGFSAYVRDIAAWSKPGGFVILRAFWVQPCVWFCDPLTERGDHRIVVRAATGLTIKFNGAYWIRICGGGRQQISDAVDMYYFAQCPGTNYKGYNWACIKNNISRCPSD